LHPGAALLHVPFRLRTGRDPPGQDGRGRSRGAVHDRRLHAPAQDSEPVPQRPLSRMPRRHAEVPQVPGPSRGHDVRPDGRHDLVSGLPRPGAPEPQEGGRAMTARPPRIRLLQVAIVLTAIFNVLALLVLVWRDTPIAFAVFM